MTAISASSARKVASSQKRKVSLFFAMVKVGNLALGCQFQFWCVETQMPGFSFGLVSPLLQNRFQFRFQFCLRTASVSGFQFRFKFHPRKLLYF